MRAASEVGPPAMLKTRPYSWKSLTLIVVVTMLSAISLGVFVVRPVFGISWPTGDSGRSYQPSFPDDSESFTPSRVVTYQDLVGLTVAEANELLGYGEGRNVYPHLPRLVGTSPMGSESPDGYSNNELIVTGMCQTRDAARTFPGRPKTTEADQVYFSVYPKSRLTASQQEVLSNPEAESSRESVEGWTRILEDEEKDCNPSLLTIPVK